MRRRRSVPWALAVALAVTMAVLSGCGAGGGKGGAAAADPIGDGEVAFTVDGEPVVWGEFRQRLSLERARAYDYFYKTYGAEDGPDFLTTAFGEAGEVPMERIVQQAKSAMVRIKLQQSLMKAEGVRADIGYDSMLAEREKENKRRKDAVRDGKVIYGPVAYGEREYFDYVFSNDLIKLKERIAERELGLGESDYESYYEANKSKLFRKGNEIRLRVLTVPYSDENGKAAAKRELEEALVRIRGGQPFEASVEEIEGGRLVDRVMNEATARSDRFEADPVALAAEALKEGETSDLLELDGGTLAIVVCDARDSLGEYPYEEAKELVRQQVVNAAYEKFVDERVRQARVEAKEDVFVRIDPADIQ